MFFDYHRTYGVAIKVGRIFNTYGPRMQADDGRIISNFVVQALENRPLTVYGDGSQTRSFCYVSDMVEALIQLMDSSHDIVGPVNLGNPHEVPVLELARRVIAMTQTSAPIVFKPLPPDDPSRRRPDIGYAREKLRWEPRRPLAEGLAATIAYFETSLRSRERRYGDGATAPAPTACVELVATEARPERLAGLRLLSGARLGLSGETGADGAAGPHPAARAGVEP